MAAPNDTIKGADQTEGFLLAEYHSLLEIDKARNERLDKLLTMFLTLAAAPWAVYALTIKDHGSLVLDGMPTAVAAVFLLVALLGFLVVMMFIQIRLTIILYMRAVNAIRGHFATATTREVLRLPTSGNVPPYYEKGSYIKSGVIGMAVVNAVYVVLGTRGILGSLNARYSWGLAAALGLALFVLHLEYYKRSARGRQRRDTGVGPVTFRPST
jgi:hypothetical protein